MNIGRECIITIKFSGIDLVWIKSISIISGPESGYSAAERETLREFGLQSLTIGHYVLRAETAPVVGLAMLHSLLGEH